MSNVAGIPPALKFYDFIPLVIHGLQEMGALRFAVNASIKLAMLLHRFWMIFNRRFFFTLGIY